MTRFGRRVRPDGRGSFEIRLPAHERGLLAQLPAELEHHLQLLEANRIPESLRRLFPVAHPTDPEREAAFVALARDELVEHHRQALLVLRTTCEQQHLSAGELEAWLCALNDLRLVLGTALDVHEDDQQVPEDDPRYAQWICYQYLSFLQSEVVDVLSGALPPPTPGADEAAPEDPWGEPLGGLRWDGTPVPGDE